MSRDNFRIKKYNIICLVVYVVIVHILFLFFFRNTFLTSYNGLLFQYNFNSEKYIICIVETFFMCSSVVFFMEYQRLAETIVVFLTLIYFIPGAVQQAVTNSTWDYMAYFFVFWVGIIAWTVILRPHNYCCLGKMATADDPEKYMLMISAISLIVTLSLSIYMGRFLTISNFMQTISDVYAVRAESTQQSVHWLILSLEYWAAYFMIAAIAFFSERKNWKIVVVLFVGEMALFVLQGNRIILFLALVAMGIGLFKIDNKRLLFGLVVIMIVCFVEVNVSSAGGITTDTFRRYTIVPNRLGEQYYDFFLTHVPDYLRSTNDRITNMLGLSSPYYSPNIGHIIGQQYYGVTMGANTGLVGGAAFCFGMAGPVISTFGCVFSFRLFEGVTAGLKDSNLIMAVALLIGSLVINTPAMLKGLFSLSYILFLYLSFVPLSLSGNKKTAIDTEICNCKVKK